MVLNVEPKQTTALNTKLKTNNDFECQTEDGTLNTKNEEI